VGGTTEGAGGPAALGDGTVGKLTEGTGGDGTGLVFVGSPWGNARASELRARTKTVQKIDMITGRRRRERPLGKPSRKGNTIDTQVRHRPAGLRKEGGELSYGGRLMASPIYTLSGRIGQRCTEPKTDCHGYVFDAGCVEIIGWGRNCSHLCHDQKGYWMGK
jgi:hypothetical protein